MEQTQESIIDFAAQRAKEVWDEKHEPYLLALLSPELKSRNVDYKAVLGQVKLKELFLSQGTDKVKLVSHPTQRAKIWLIPHDKNFAYPAQQHVAATASEIAGFASVPSRSQSPRFIVMNFIQLLATLPKEEAEKVHIPASVLAMLIKAP